MNHYFNFSTKINYRILAIFWVLSQVLYAVKYGFVTNLEAEKYIYQSEYFIEFGNFSSKNFIFYSIHIFLITVSKITNTFPWLVFMFQILLNGLSVYLFYKLCFRFSKSNYLSFLFTMLFLIMIYYHLYNVYLFTESLFFSLSIIYTYILFTTSKFNWSTILLISLLLAIIYFTRPVGVFFIPATIIFLLIKFFRKYTLIISGISFFISIVVLYLLLNFALKSGGEFDFLLPYQNGMIICGVSTFETSNNIKVPVEKNSIEGLWYIMTNHTSLFINLSLKRLIAFWGVTRSYYSLLHNIFIAIYFYSFYVFIVLGAKKNIKEFPSETLYFVSIILLTMITVAVSCDEWHNRFILALLPFFILLSIINFKKGKNSF